MSFPDEIERAYIMEKGILEGIFEHIVSIEQFDYLLGSWEDPLWDLVWQSEAYNSNESFLEYVNCYQHVGGKILPWLDEFLELVNDEKIDGVRNLERARKLRAFQEALSDFKEYLILDFYLMDCQVSDTIKIRHTERQGLEDNEVKDIIREQSIKSKQNRQDLLIKSLIDTHRELYASLKEYFGKPSPQSTLSESLQEDSDNFNKKEILAESMGLEVNTTKKLTADSDSIPTVEQIKDYLQRRQQKSYSGNRFDEQQDLSKNIKCKYENIKKILNEIGEAKDSKLETVSALANKLINPRKAKNKQILNDSAIRKQLPNLAKLVHEKLTD
jgi:ribonuclease HI